MPEVSRFFGIVIRMYFDDHDPPHFQAVILSFLRGSSRIVRRPWSWSGRHFINGR